ncbi:NAD-dependent epimerase/dehydratase family protein [Spirillospora sp. NPDC050679]
MKSDSRSLDERSLILVTGGSGFFGGHLTAALLAAGHAVRVADIRPPAGGTPPGAEFAACDLCEVDQVAAACAGVTHIFHLAGNPSGTRSVTDPLWDFRVNALATTNLCQAAVSASVRRMVYVSSGMVYGVPLTTPIGEDHPLTPFIPYAASKLSAEQSVLAAASTYGLDASVARPFTLYGPGEDPATSGGEVSRFLRWHLNDLPVPVTGDPDLKSRDFTHVDDAVAALRTIMDRGEAGAAYNVGTGRETTLTGLLEIIESATGRAPRAAVDAGTTDDTYRHVADIGRLRALGHRPAIGVEAGIRSMVAALGPAPEVPTLPTVFTMAGTPRAS